MIKSKNSISSNENNDTENVLCSAYLEHSNFNSDKNLLLTHHSLLKKSIEKELGMEIDHKVIETLKEDFSFDEKLVNKCFHPKEIIYRGTEIKSSNTIPAKGNNKLSQNRKIRHHNFYKKTSHYSQYKNDTYDRVSSKYYNKSRFLHYFDKTQIEEKENYNDFNLSEYRYSYTNENPEKSFYSDRTIQTYKKF